MTRMKQAMEQEGSKDKDIPETTSTCAQKGGYSSPPCYAHEWDTAYSGPASFSARELSDLLGTLLGAERTGVEIMDAYTRERGLDFAESALREVCASGLDNCVLLSKLSETNEFELAAATAEVDRALAIPDSRKRIEFLVHWYSRIAQRIKDALPHIADAETFSKLKEVYARHLINISILEDAHMNKSNNV